MSVYLFSIAVALVLIAALLLIRQWRRNRRVEAPWPISEARQHLVVLAHGLLGFDHLKVLGTRHHYFRGIADHLRSHGVAVETARVRPLGTVPERAAALASFIEDLGERRVIIVGHSMGGLDARYALNEFDLVAKVSALVTIGTPHRGTCLADAASMAPARALRSLLGRVGVTTDALGCLGEGYAQNFNESISDMPGVFYGCIVGQTTRARVLGNPLLLACFELLLKLRGENDGLVPVSSQRWGKELNVVPAHHFGQIGWSPLFDANRMYLQLLSDLDASGLPCLPRSFRSAELPAQVSA